MVFLKTPGGELKCKFIQLDFFALTCSFQKVRELAFQTPEGVQ